MRRNTARSMGRNTKRGSDAPKLILQGRFAAICLCALHHTPHYSGIMTNVLPAMPQVLPTARDVSVEGKPPLRLLLALSALMSLGSLSTDMYLPALPTHSA
jgi:hypothetical protein